MATDEGRYADPKSYQLPQTVIINHQISKMAAATIVKNFSLPFSNNKRTCILMKGRLLVLKNATGDLRTNFNAILKHAGIV